jgi:DNA repair protein RecO (recombination protein O)
LALPAFLRAGPTGAVTEEDLRAGFALTGHFLETRVLRPRELQMPDPRMRLLSYLGRNSGV